MMIKIEDIDLFKDIINSIKKLVESVQILIQNDCLYLYGMNTSKTLFFEIKFAEITFQNREKYDNNDINVYTKDFKNQIIDIGENDLICLELDNRGILIKITSEEKKVTTNSVLRDLLGKIDIDNQIREFESYYRKKMDIDFTINGNLIKKILKSAGIYSNEINIIIKKEEMILENSSSVGKFNSSIKIDLSNEFKLENQYTINSFIEALIFSDNERETNISMKKQGPLITKTHLSKDSYSLIIINLLSG